MAKFQKGKSGNSKGRTPMPEEYRKFKAMTALQIKELYEKYLSLTRKEIDDIIDDENNGLKSLEAWILKSILQGITDGDYSMLDKMLNRIIGMPSQRINFSGTLHTQPADIAKIKRWRKEQIKK